MNWNNCERKRSGMFEKEVAVKNLLVGKGVGDGEQQ
jgi:hypothetical protein